MGLLETELQFSIVLFFEQLSFVVMTASLQRPSYRTSLGVMLTYDPCRPKKQNETHNPKAGFKHFYRSLW